MPTLHLDPPVVYVPVFSLVHLAQHLLLVLQQGREDVFKLRNVRIEQVVLCQCRVNGHRGRSTLEGGLDSLVYQTEGWGEMRAASDI